METATKAFFQHSLYPPLCAAKWWASECGAVLWEDNVRRLSNPASMTLPLAVLLDYQPFTASVTSVEPFTTETRHSPPTVAHYGHTAASAGPGSAHLSLGSSKQTHCLLLKLIQIQSPENMPLCLKLWFWSQYNQIGLLVERCYWLTCADGSSQIIWTWANVNVRLVWLRLRLL